MSAIRELAQLLREANIRPTLDEERNNTRPCWCCGKAASPCNALHPVGSVASRLYGGGHERGDWVERPVCRECSRWLFRQALKVLGRTV